MEQARCSAACGTLVVFTALLMLFAASVVFPVACRADELSGYLEYQYTKDDTDSVDSGGQLSRTRSDSLSQLYNLTLDKHIYPNLRFLARGIFKRTDAATEINGVENDTAITTVQPYLSLNLKTPLYRVDTAYQRNEEKVKSSGSSPFTTVRELFFTTFLWKPDRFPDLKLQYSNEQLYDKSRSFLDTATDRYQLTSNYRPVAPLLLYYQGTFRDSEFRVSETSEKEVTHNGRVTYANAFWRRRITFGAEYEIRDQSIDTETAGAGEVGIQVFPSSGLSALSDTPENVPLVLNSALVDGNLTDVSGINLGLPPPGGDARLRNIGLDFLVATEINTLLVWVDRDVEQVADTFSWRIYTSSDNQRWELRQTVFPASYSRTFNRFEIRFSNVNSRFVKVVTSPLSPAVPFASSFPEIMVTELQSELRRPASEVAGERTSTSHTGNADFRAVILEYLNLTYESAFFFTKRDPGDLTYSLSNGLSFYRQLTKVFSGTGRVAFEIGDDRDGSRETLLFSTSLTAVPIQTLSHALTLSGKEETRGERRKSERSIQLYNIAKIYEGIDATLNGVISFQEDESGQKTRSTLVNAGATFVPNPKATFTLMYNGIETVESGGSLPGEASTYTRGGEASLSIAPVKTVYLFGSFRVDSSNTSPSRNILNYSLNWAPFPDGTLHLSLLYNETIRSDDTKETLFSPSLQWYFRRRSYLNLSYQNRESESPTQTTSSDVYSGTVRISF